MGDIEKIVFLDITGVLKRVGRSWRDGFSCLKDACARYELVGTVLEEDEEIILLSPMNSLNLDDSYMIPFLIPKGIILERKKLYECKKP